MPSPTQPLHFPPQFITTSILSQIVATSPPHFPPSPCSTSTTNSVWPAQSLQNRILHSHPSTPVISHYLAPSQPRQPPLLPTTTFSPSHHTPPIPPAQTRLICITQLHFQTSRYHLSRAFPPHASEYLCRRHRCCLQGRWSNNSPPEPFHRTLGNR